MNEKELSTDQIKALNLIMQGKTDIEIAETLKIDRVTIWRWKNKDLLFISELNKLKNSFYKSLLTKEQLILDKSYKVIQEELDSGKNKVQIALAIIKGIKQTNKKELKEEIEDIANEMDDNEIIKKMSKLQR